MAESGNIPLSVVVIAQDEREHIADCLASAPFAAELLVLDGGSKDETVALAEAAGARVETRAFDGWISQKNAALDLATHDWVLSLDADERVSPELAAEIVALFTGADGGIDVDAPALAGYDMPRRAHHLGKWIRGGGWYPDRKLRLFRRSQGRWGGRDPHDKLMLEGEAGRLRGDLLHYPYRDLAHHLAKMDRYTDTAAARLHEDGRRGASWRRFVQPPLGFLKSFLLKAGFRDGAVGWRLAMLHARYEWLRYSKLHALQRGARR
ncbi:MAG: glycosyltransferase family 2 protein [Planctomycetota bacterium]|jgi:glycosyltransferase involved in cell wall biosynthesis